MARAQYIWIVTTKAGGVLAPFTVKHEMQTWLDKSPIDRDCIRISRHADAGGMTGHFFGTEPRTKYYDPHTLEELKGDG